MLPPAAGSSAPRIKWTRVIYLLAKASCRRCRSGHLGVFQPLRPKTTTRSPGRAGRASCGRSWGAAGAPPPPGGGDATQLPRGRAAALLPLPATLPSVPLSVRLPSELRLLPLACLQVLTNPESCCRPALLFLLLSLHARKPLSGTFLSLPGASLLFSPLSSLFFCSSW